MNMSGFLAGTIVGLIAGILMAPDKGENTRENLTQSAQRWRNRFRELKSSSEKELEDLKEYLNQNIHGLTNDVRNRILMILEEAQDLAYSPGSSRVASGKSSHDSY